MINKSAELICKLGRHNMHMLTPTSSINPLAKAHVQLTIYLAD